MTKHVDLLREEYYVDNLESENEDYKSFWAQKDYPLHFGGRQAGRVVSFELPGIWNIGTISCGLFFCRIADKL